MNMLKSFLPALLLAAAVASDVEAAERPFAPWIIYIKCLEDSDNSNVAIIGIVALGDSYRIESSSDCKEWKSEEFTVLYADYTEGVPWQIIILRAPNKHRFYRAVIK